MGEKRPELNVLENLRQLRSDDPVERKHGIVALSGMVDDSRVLRVFEHLYENDPDPSVRQLAWRAINRQGPSIPAPGPVGVPAAPVAVAPEKRPSRGTRPRRSAPSQQEPFLLNPSNARHLVTYARQPSRRSGSRFFLVLAALFFLGAGLIWGWVLPGWIDQIRLDRSGVTTGGEIIRLYVEPDGSGDHRYYASYRFPAEGTAADGLIYRREQRLTASAYASVAPGSLIDVTYLPDQPDVLRLSVETPAAVQRDLLTAIAAGLSVIAALLLLFGVFQRERAPHARREGTMLWGEVVRCAGKTEDDGDFTVRLRYQFRTPKGRLLVKQTNRVRNDLVASDLPEPGVPVIVYYQSEKNHRIL